MSDLPIVEKREQFVCRSCRKGSPEWMCQCANDAAWEEWMREQELRSAALTRAKGTDNG